MSIQPLAATAVPLGVRRWFVVHFIADLLFAAPLFIAPVITLRQFGWETVDPVATRLVASAFLAIGTTSLLTRNADASSYRSLLILKLIWSVMALISLMINLVHGAPLFTWAAVAIFVVFFFVWAYYFKKLKSS